MWVSPPEEPPVEGKEAFRSWWEDLYAEYTIQASASDIEIEAVGDWGFVRGVWVATVTAKEGGEPETGSYGFLLVVRRGTDGVWREARAVWSRNAPSP